LLVDRVICFTSNKGSNKDKDKDKDMDMDMDMDNNMDGTGICNNMHRVADGIAY
jgi:hypothetical protein